MSFTLASPTPEASTATFWASDTPVNRSNALSNKITGMLSSSYADLDIRDALDTVDEMGFSNTAESRRLFRQDVQKEVIDCNGEIIDEFGHVAQQLKAVGGIISNLNRCMDDMRAHIASARSQTAPVLKEASSLISQKQKVETQQQLLKAFNAHFLISDAENETLTFSTDGVDDDFFITLTRVKRIHKDCQVLLGAENQTLGLEVMEQSSRTLNAAYQKLFRWVQREFKSLKLENPQLSSRIRRALRVLAERPTLFQTCLDSFAEAREHMLSDAFYAALTGTTVAGAEPSLTKPIELFAHDSLRYIGDMLAWLHSATASEKEALEVLFISEGDEMAKGIQAGLESEPWNRADDSDVTGFEGPKALTNLVNRDMTGVMRMIRQRVEQVIQGHEDPTLAYQIANLIGFYRVTVTRLLGDESPVKNILIGLADVALRQFRETMRDHVSSVQGDMAPAPADLRPPDFLQEALERLKGLLKSFETSLAPETRPEAGLDPILAEALDPFLNLCERLAEALDESDNSIFVLNCLLAIKEVLSLFTMAADRVSDTDDTIEEYSSKLVEHQHAFFLHASGMHPMVVALASNSNSEQEHESLSQLEPFHNDALIHTSQTLDNFLPSAIMDAMERLKRLRDSRLAHEITEQAANRFCEDFDYVEANLVAADELAPTRDTIEEGSDVERMRAVFPRTSAEIRVLLS
ncbi:MAG: Golgi transport complex subunit 6 [Caeruleum heppii]|nr:MAG: Golgi transport complex subunit 6 [Caeruleum heppii]